MAHQSARSGDAGRHGALLLWRPHALGGIHRLGDLADAREWAQGLAEFAPLKVVAHELGLEASNAEGRNGEPRKATSELHCLLASISASARGPTLTRSIARG